MNLKLVLLIGFVLIAAVVLEWRNLRKASPGNRWFFLIMLLASGGLWIYITTGVHVPRPINWLMAVLEPFDPIQ
ncbi:hypothetical protein DUZ99_12175 [Xylanibacillus composti]|uniref:Uncharacterized protein n=1 Tax=Xylanibacillus composti TaxID=1572762 RepID=A0A8J4M3R1_9BACL|nr:hypothetical protein [Xylanibacillus composti]MDT9725731.1 hypothetical protein [Xylanibacillus composti]GIQ71130.1 hypothetical protein XYCOK13_39540 [Xylanibacillus composti]